MNIHLDYNATLQQFRRLKAHTAAHWWAQQGLAVPGDNVWQHSIKTLDQLFLLHYSRLCADKKCFGGESDDH